jgi:tetratricopeptide (TPR) repeat protein
MAREWYELGVSWQEKGDWKKAGEAYSRAIALDPSFAAASFNLARALTESGDYAGALRVLNELAKKDPGNVRVLSARAYALYKKGDAAAALEAYREVVALDPYAPDIVFNAALLELGAGNAQAAVEALERLTKAKSDDGEAFALLGKALDKLGSDEKTPAASGQTPAASGQTPATSERALAAYERARELGKADAAALSRIGQLREARKEYSEAMDAYSAAVKTAPRMAATWFALARLRLTIAGDGEKGLDALKNAIASGFSDTKKAAALIDEPTLVEREKVQKLLAEAGLAK